MNLSLLRSLQRADLNSLVTLSVLLELRSTTAAAEQLAKTQSAISHTLKKLRIIFDDELLIKNGKSLELTSRAKSLQPLLEKTLKEINVLITEPDGFIPETSQREFKIAAPNLYASRIGAFSASVAESAPELSIQMLPPTSTSFNELIENKLDLLIAPAVKTPPSIRSVEFEIIDWAVFASASHAVTNRTIKNQWTKWPHIQVTTGESTRSPIDDALIVTGVKRKLSLRVPDFLTAMSVVSSRTDLLFTAPHKPLETLAAQFDLKVLSCPIDLPQVPMSLYTSKLRNQTEDIEWLLAQISQNR